MTLWDLYYPLPYFNAFMFKQKPNQLSQVSTPNSKFFKYLISVITIVCYTEKAEAFHFKCFKLVRQQHVMVEKE